MMIRKKILSIFLISAVLAVILSFHSQNKVDAATCGNGVCEPGENCSNCSIDCGSCGPTCGNGVCEPGENCSNCSIDCGSCPPSYGGERVVGRVTTGQCQFLKDLLITSSDGKVAGWDYNEQPGCGFAPHYHIGRWSAGTWVTITLSPPAGYNCRWHFDPTPGQNGDESNGFGCAAYIKISSGNYSPDWQNHLWFHLEPALPICIDECIPPAQEQRCSGNWVQKRECGQYDNDSCWDWSQWQNYKDCSAEGKICELGNCVPIPCTPINAYVEPNPVSENNQVVFIFTSDRGYTWVNLNTGGGAKNCELDLINSAKCGNNPKDNYRCWWKWVCKATSKGSYTATFSNAENCSKSVSFTVILGCQNECSFEGQTETRCEGNYVQKRTCGNYDSDSCLEWSSWQNHIFCPNYCKNSACIDVPTVITKGVIVTY